MKSVKRTAESERLRVHLFVQSSALRTQKNLATSPSAEALGYVHSVRFADGEAMFLRQGPGSVCTAYLSYNAAS